MADASPPGAPRPPLAPLFLFIPGKVFRDARLSWPAKFAYGLLASIADEDGKCWPTVTRIADSFTPALSPRHARRVLTELVGAGWLVRRIKARREDPRAPNDWHLTGPLPMRADRPPRTNLSGGTPGRICPGPPDESVRQSIESSGEDSSLPEEPGLSTSQGFLSTTVENELAPYLAGHRMPEAVRAIILGALTGISGPGGRPAPEDAIVAALGDMKANSGFPFSALYFRNALAKQMRPPEAEGDAGAPAARAPRAPRPTGQGMADRLRAKREAGAHGTDAGGPDAP